MKRSRQEESKEGTRRKLVEEVFKERPTREREEILKELEQKRITLTPQQSRFAQRLSDSTAHAHSQEILQQLGCRAWRKRQQLGDLRAVVIGQELEVINEMWCDHMRAFVARHPAGIPSEALRELEWHGARVKIKSARNPLSVGVEGIVFALTELELWVVDENGKKWRVDKDGTALDVLFDDKRLELDGSFCFERDIQVGKKLRRRETRKQNKNLKHGKSKDGKVAGPTPMEDVD